MGYKRSFIIYVFLVIIVIFWCIWHVETSYTMHKENKSDIQINNFKQSIYTFKNKIIVETDVLRLVINKSGGNIEQADLLKYNKTLGSLENYRLLDTSKNFIYQAQSGLTGIHSAKYFINNVIPNYITSKKLFKWNFKNKKIIVPMRWESSDGIIYLKTFTLIPGQYVIKVNFDIFNNTQNFLKLSVFGQLKQTVDITKILTSNQVHDTFQKLRSSAFSTDEHDFNKYDFNNIKNNKNILIPTKSGWISMFDQYFATAWIPSKNWKNVIYTKNLGNNTVAIGYKSDVISVDPNVKHTISSKLWIGPKVQEQMALVAKNLDLTVDYGWLWFLAQPLFKLLNFIYKIVHNWGIAIIIITVIIKVIMFPLSRMQYVSIAKIRTLQPQIDKIKKKYENDRKKLSHAIIDLYKVEKINPLSGFLPLLIQMPIFLALYYMLMNSVELRHAPFMLWIYDLSSKDPYYILPIIMGCTMYIIQRMSSNNSLDINQQKIMNFMPVILTTFFLWFPSGLVLYYIVSNLLTIIQQKLLSYSILKNK